MKRRSFFTKVFAGVLAGAGAGAGAGAVLCRPKPVQCEGSIIGMGGRFWLCGKSFDGVRNLTLIEDARLAIIATQAMLQVEHAHLAHLAHELEVVDYTRKA